MAPKRYIITVTEKGQEVRTIGKQWAMGVGTTPDEYGYTPETEATRDYEREIFRQEVSELDLAELVQTINKPA